MANWGGASGTGSMQAQQGPTTAGYGPQQQQGPDPRQMRQQQRHARRQQQMGGPSAPPQGVEPPGPLQAGGGGGGGGGGASVQPNGLPNLQAQGGAGFAAADAHMGVQSTMDRDTSGGTTMADRQARQDQWARQQAASGAQPFRNERGQTYAEYRRGIQNSQSRGAQVELQSEADWNQAWGGPGSQASAQNQPGGPAGASQPPPQTRTPVDHRTYQGVDFNTLQPGAPVAGQPGATWNHTGQGWEIVSGGSGGGSAPGSTVSGPQPNPALMSPYGPYPGRPDQTVVPGMTLPGWQNQTYTQTQAPGAPNLQGGYAPPSYQQQQMGGFNAPQRQELQNLQLNALQQALTNNPYNEANTGAMKERLKEQAVQIGEQNKQGLAEGAIARGRLGGGFAEAANAGQDQSTQEQILKGFRDIDLAAAQGKQASTLAAADAINASLSGEMSRASQGFQNNLASYGANQGERQFGANFGRQTQLDSAQLGQQDFTNAMARAGFQSGENQFGWNAGMANQQAALQQALAQHGINMDVAGNAQQNYGTDLGAFFQNANLGLQRHGIDAGIGVDYARLNESGRQFNLGHALNVMQFLENQRQANQGFGLQAGGINAGLYNNWMNRIWPS